MRANLLLVLLLAIAGCDQTIVPPSNDDDSSDDDDATGDDDDATGDDDDATGDDDDAIDDDDAVDDDDATELTCSSDEELECGGADAFNNAAGNPVMDAYDCPAGLVDGETGSEVVYALTPTADENVGIELAGLVDDLDLIVLQDFGDGCTPTACIAASTNSATASETLVFPAEAGVTYYVVVDGYNGASGGYQLRTSCPPEALGDDDDAADDDDDDATDDDDVTDDDDTVADDDDTTVDGDCTLGAEALCSTPISGDTTTGQALITDYGCPGSFSASGPEILHAFTPVDSGEYTANLTGMVVDLDLFVLEDVTGCNPSDCVDFAATFGDESVTWTAVGGTTYYLVADGFIGAAGAYTLEVSCPTLGDDDDATGDDDDTVADDDDTVADDDDTVADDDDTVLPAGCTDSWSLSCDGDTSDTWNNGAAGSTNDVEDWGCYSLTYDGPEQIYAWTPDDSGDYSITLTGLFADLDLFLLEDTGGGCDPDSCIEYSSSVGDESLEVTATAGTTYYIVVDGWNGAVSDYTLSLQCGESCAPVGGLTCFDGQDSFNNSGVGSTNVHEDSACGSFFTYSSPEVAYEFTPLTGGTFTVDLTGLAADLALFVYEGSASGDCAFDTCLEESDGAGWADETLTFTGVGGTTYFILVDGFLGDTSDYDLQLTCN